MLSDLSPEITDHILKSQFFGRLGCAAEGQVLVLPMAYFYDGKALYGRSREGTKTRLMRQNPAVCFEVDEVLSLTCWRSVVVQGVFEELQGEDRAYAEQLLGPGRLAPKTVAEGQEPELSVPVVVYRIQILSKTGRSETK